MEGKKIRTNSLEKKMFLGKFLFDKFTLKKCFQCGGKKFQTNSH